MAFLIMARQRSGTGMLTTALNSHPDIWCEDETEPIEELRKGLVAEEAGKPIQIKNGLCFLKRWPKKDFKVWGANLKYSQLNRHIKTGKTIHKKFKIVHLIRRNLLSLAISQIINESKRTFGINHHEYKPVQRKKKLFVTPQHIDKIKQIITVVKLEVYKHDKMFSDQKLQVFTVYYEDLCEDYLEYPIELCQFLNVLPRKLVPATIKTGTDDLSQVIDNYEDIEEQLNGLRIHL